MPTRTSRLRTCECPRCLRPEGRRGCTLARVCHLTDLNTMERPLPEPWVPRDDVAPPTQPKGALVPPPRLPPTAVGAAAAGPEPRPARPARSWPPPKPARRRSPWVRRVKRALDIVDDVADGLWSLGKLIVGSTLR